VKLATPRWRMSFVLTALVLLAGLVVPAAGAAVKSQILFLAQPADTEVNATITAVDLPDPTSTTQFVTVKVVDGMDRPLANKTVSFKLVTNAGASAKGLHVTPQVTDASGVATFGEGTLSISVLNEPKFSPYRLVPITVKGTFITGPASVPFNIWEDGDSCGGGGECTAELRGKTSRGGVDTYTSTSPGAGTLGASQLPASAYPSFPPPGACEGQRAIFAGSAFVNVSTESATTPGPVFLRSHITRQDFRDAGADFGQAHVEWCIGLESNEPWKHNNTLPTPWDGDGDGITDLYVAFAPACPNLNPALSAPCITDQRSDGAGGSITEGFIPGGDPVRRT
jgi:hypothetical protein